MHTRTFLLQLPPPFITFEIREISPSQTQTYPAKVIHFAHCLLFGKYTWVIKSHFPHPLLSQVRSEWNKINFAFTPSPYSTDHPLDFYFGRFSNPPVYYNPPAFFVSNFFPTLIYCYSLLSWTREYALIVYGILSNLYFSTQTTICWTVIL